MDSFQWLIHSYFVCYVFWYWCGCDFARYAALYRQTPKKIGMCGTLSTFVGLLSVIVSLFFIIIC